MREVVFLKKNKAKWQEVEKLLNDSERKTPDEMADLFIELTDDLSYARTNYPKSETTDYLNDLTSGIFQKINKNKKDNTSRFLNFWRFEIPLEISKVHKQLLYSFIFFTVCVLIGVVSTAYDESFPRIVLGDNYVDMTIENIDKGDPMNVYKDEDRGGMFFYITMNNIRVSSYTFIAGILFSLGTYYFLFINGVMLGTFQYFFHTKGLFFTSFLTIWIHGTIEISCIIIAGAAGIILGNSFLFPGTFKRKNSVVIGAKRALKVFIGIIPLIVLAGFLESFITRLTDSPVWVRLGIILTSALFILWYFVLYPIKLKRQLIK